MNNKRLIAILGIIVLGVSGYYIIGSFGEEELSFQEDVVHAQVSEGEVTELSTEESSDEARVEGVVEEYQLTDAEADIKVAYQVGQEQEVKRIIASQHEYLNNLAGWGKVESINFEQLIDDRDWNQLQQDIKWLYEEGFAPSAILNDMSHASQFHTLALTGDQMSIRYLHRIFHDLDAKINQIDVEQIWNVTDAFGTEQEQTDVQEYLNSSTN
ncbi:hypothetical protein [Bacillus suaedae]|uniref:Uncharacterized protein n=1 Tax=Halalkalibacter suaedae TaxID=2822140 RepID=A0A940WPV1_9BACI|nr:hypothetical protein [Bacillus suaedae]MBP3950479.1 hypothetical protein [Bacillus suaedae]